MVSREVPEVRKSKYGVPRPPYLHIPPYQVEYWAPSRPLPVAAL